MSPALRCAAPAAASSALGKLEDYSANVIFRHEHTLSGPKADRLELLRHTRTHTGQLFMLYSDPAPPEWTPSSRKCSPRNRRSPNSPTNTASFTASGSIAEPHRIAAIQKAMADQKLVIADGHHRYETSLNFRNECRTRAGKLIPDAPLRILHDDLHQHAQRRPDHSSHAPRGRQPARFFLERRSPLSRTVVRHRSLPVRSAGAAPAKRRKIPAAACRTQNRNGPSASTQRRKVPTARFIC